MECVWAPRDRHEVYDVISRPEPSCHSPGGRVDTSWPETLSCARVVTVRALRMYRDRMWMATQRQFATYGL